MKNVRPFKYYGWRGKILQVDLTRSKLWVEDLPEELTGDYTGGAGVNARLFYELVRGNPDLDPLSPDNPQIFGCGPVVGTSFPCATRFTVTAKSLKSQGKNTPFLGYEMQGKVRYTFVNGQLVYRRLALSCKAVKAKANRR